MVKALPQSSFQSTTIILRFLSFSRARGMLPENEIMESRQNNDTHARTHTKTKRSQRANRQVSKLTTKTMHQCIISSSSSSRKHNPPRPPNLYPRWHWRHKDLKRVCGYNTTGIYTPDQKLYFGQTFQHTTARTMFWF